MDSSYPAQTLETPFNMSDFVDFDFDFEVPHQSVEMSAVAESFQGMNIDNADFDPVDPDFAAVFQLPDGSNAMGNGFNNTTTAAPFGGFPTVEPRLQSMEMADAFGSSIDAGAAIGGLGMTEPFQTTFEETSALNGFTGFEPAPFNHGIDPAVLTIPRSAPMLLPQQVPGVTIPRAEAHYIPQAQLEPSRWVPVSAGLQRRLNLRYAPQISRHRISQTSAPVLYFPREQNIGFSQLTSSFSPMSLPAPCNFLHTSYPRPDLNVIDPSLLMLQPASNGIYDPVFPGTDDETASDQDTASTSIKKRARDAYESDSESAPKRSEIAQEESSLTIAMDENSDDDNEHESVAEQTTTAPQTTPSTLAKDDDLSGEPSDASGDNADDEYHDSQSSTHSSTPPAKIPTPTSNPLLKKGPSWRYNQQHGSRLRAQREKQWNRRRATASGPGDKAPNRRMQQLLAEIEDTEGFAEAQGYRHEERGEGKPVSKRPVRKAARKSYVGLE